MSSGRTDGLHLSPDLLIIIADDKSGRASTVLTETFYLQDNEQAQIVSGKHDAHLRLIESALNVRIVPRGLELAISGDSAEVSKAAWVLRNIASLGPNLTGHDVHYAIKLAEAGEKTTLQEIGQETVVTTHRGSRSGLRQRVNAAILKRLPPMILCSGSGLREPENLLSYGGSHCRPKAQRCGTDCSNLAGGRSRRTPRVFAW